MNAKLTHVPLAVTEQDRALEYYTKKLGFEKRSDYKGPTGARWLTVAPKGSDVEFALILGKQQARVDGAEDPKALQVAFSTTDCRADYEAMKARGVRFDIPGFETLQRAVWGTSAYFRDLDGNPFAMVQQSWIGKMMVKAFAKKKKKK
jgi:catechol 2,3-dioxygenase-like lactoylglutathione lyase family enzyme